MANLRLTDLPSITHTIIGAVMLVSQAGASYQLPMTPRYDVRCFGAVGNGSTNDTAAIALAINTCAGLGGGDVYFPPGSYLTDLIALSSVAGVSLVGAGPWVSRIIPRQTGNRITLTSCLDCAVKHLSIEQTGASFGGGYGINLVTCTRVSVENVGFAYLSGGVRVDRCADTTLIRLNGEQFLSGGGQGLIRLIGSASVSTTRTRIFKCRSRNVYNADVTFNLTPKTWAQSTAYAVRDTIFNGDNLYECTGAGTSAASGSGPTTVPGTTGPTAFSTNITDGSVTWRFVGGHAFALDIDSYVKDVIVDGLDVHGESVGLITRNSLGGAAAPSDIRVRGLKCFRPYIAGWFLENGSDVRISDWDVDFCISNNGAVVDSGFTSEAHIGAGRTSRSWNHGVLYQAGATEVHFRAVRALDNSRSGSGNASGITTGANATRFSIVGCASRGTSQSHGVLVNSGATSYLITDNDVDGNLTGGVSHPNGANSRVKNNRGMSEELTSFESTGASGSTISRRVHELSARVQTTDATVTTLSSLALPNGSISSVSARVVARKDATDQAGYFLRAVVTQEAGTAALVGTVDQLTREDQGGWDATIDASGSSVRVRVTGAAATNIEWWVHWTVEILNP